MSRIALILFAALLGALQPAALSAATLATDKVVFSDGNGARTTAPFSTAVAGEWLIAFAASDGPGSSAQTLTVTGAGLTWTLVQRVNAQAGTSEIWKANAASVLSNVTVTSTQSAGGYYQSLTVVTFSAAAGTGNAIGANGPSGAPTATLTTTKANSLVYGVGNDWDRAVSRTVGANQAMVHQYLAPAGDTFWVQNRVDPIPVAATPVPLNDTAPTNDRWNLAVVEIVPAAAVVPSFQVDAYNDSITVGLADSGTYNLLLSPSDGFTGAVSCVVSGLPAGAVGTFVPPGGPPHPGPFALTVNTDTTTQPATYQPSVTCTDGSSSASKTLTLIVTTALDFRVVVEPNSLIVSQGQTGASNFDIQPMNGFAQGVTLSASGLPSGVSAAFTPATLSPPGSGTVQFTVGAFATPGVYQLLVRATSTDDALTRQAAFQLTILQANAAGSWRQQALGDTPALYYGVIVGDVGNTGRARVYASGGLGVMYEYAFDGTSWSFARMPVGVTADSEMHNMAIGPGRADGVNRLYIAVSGGDKVYECSWISGNWQCPIMATLAGATDIIIGDGRNDGRTRMYISWMSGTTEFTWNGTSWTQVTMSNNEGGWVHGIDLGPGRDDGINRVYTANQGNGAINEYSWNGSVWTKVLIGSTGDSRNLEIAQGRNDGKFRVYVPSGDSNVYELTWTGSTWQQVSIGNAGAGGVKVQSIPAKARSDNLVRVYAAAADGGVYEYTWTGSVWQTVSLGLATAYMYGLAAGDGLNNGTTQVYGSSYDGNAYLFEWISALPPPVAVPNVVGLTQAVATTTILNNGLTLGTVTNEFSTTVPAQSVISQNPAAGTLVSPASAVALVVSSGPPPPVPVPNVVALTQAAAVTAIVNAGLTLGTVTNESSTTVPVGSVISQDPAAATPVPSGSPVNLVVSSGVIVPNVVGQPQSAVADLLGAVNLVVGTVTTQSSTSVPIDVVISQSPAANTQASGGSTVSLVVSSGPPPPVSVPDVVALTQAAAMTAIVNGGLTLGTVTNVTSTTVPVGVVISQDPVAATLVASGSPVNLVVSSGVTVPNVVGQPQSAVAGILGAVSLVVGTVTPQSSTTVPIGVVIGQAPIANTQVSGGSAVNLVVSSGVIVPNVVGQPQSAVASILGAVGLGVGTVSTQPSMTVPVGVVISQDPAANTQASGGSAVNLVVSSGVTVPNVVGQPQTAVAGILGPVGLVVGTVSTQSSVSVPIGVVISQDPVANTQVTGGTAVNLVVSSGPPPSGPTVDRVLFSDGSGTRTIAVSTSGPAEVLLAFAASDGPRTGSAQTLTVSGGGLSWTLVRRANAQLGTAEIWRATAASQLSNAVVSCSQSRGGGYHQSLTVVAFAGASGTGASAIASGATGAPGVTLTTTKPGSLVYGVGNDWDRAVGRTVGAGQTMVHQWIDSQVGDTNWVQAWTGAVANAGVSIRLNDTAPTNDRWNFASVEIVR